ncbi:endonuclease/exonuclease/phosphatase family protein [Flavobacterium weaverense]|uniref:Endonuclease/exonuclease/phosphatase (EEP) superfamily protein YafD n=1 Tax=Flavobacterium weaverense TaxID=271156 RepID=A0A3L9ZUC3_9FLAO|nr:endonuclease/exonuclease/phosphatase family protein [Flavobacterium weaverense]RMA74879.1 endonuclease/exonuclease/phosphatase (EEP) superfamily protein YafD [Flavobacterium weaverense]
MWFIIISTLLLLASALPYLPLTHWFYRFFEFGKIQILVLQIFALFFSFIALENFSIGIRVLQLLTSVSIVIHIATLYKYTSFYKSVEKQHCDNSSKMIKVLSANVYQDNTDYHSFIALINKYDPDIFLTMESDEKWENALLALDSSYKYKVKVAQSNTYGMHLYSKVKIVSHEVHYFVANDLPSIEAKLETTDNYKFTFFAVHPPPPSPTEEENSKERDGELLSIAKKIKQNSDTCVVVGDFNNVAWAKSSILFRKTSLTLDGRIGRGFISSFHTKYWFLRFPIDLMFHTPDVFIEELKSLEHFGSDHFPIFAKFFINKKTVKQEPLIENLEEGEREIVAEIITEGKNEKSDNRN